MSMERYTPGEHSEMVLKKFRPRPHPKIKFRLNLSWDSDYITDSNTILSCDYQCKKILRVEVMLFRYSVTYYMTQTRDSICNTTLDIK